jgi:hypothetical protein
MPSTVSYLRISTNILSSWTFHLAPVDIAAYGWKNVNFAAATQDELTEYQGVPNAENNKLWDDSFNSCKRSQFDCDVTFANEI